MALFILRISFHVIFQCIQLLLFSFTFLTGSLLVIHCTSCVNSFITKFLDPNSFVNCVNVFEENDSVEPPVPTFRTLITDYVSEDFSDFFDDIPDFSLIEDEFNGGALPDDIPRLVETDSEFLVEDVSFLPDEFRWVRYCGRCG